MVALSELATLFVYIRQRGETFTPLLRCIFPLIGTVVPAAPDAMVHHPAFDPNAPDRRLAAVESGGYPTDWWFAAHF